MANMFDVEVVNPLQALLLGQQSYASGQEANKKQAMERARTEAGQLYAAGDTKGALARLLTGGDLQGAGTYSGLDQQQYQRGRDTVNDARADRRETVEDRRWNASFGLQKRAADRADEDKPVIKEVTNPDGSTGLVRIPQRGPEGPIAGATSSPTPRKLSINDITKLSEEGQKYSTLSSVTDKFEDRFAGYLPGTGDVSMSAGRYLPQGLVGKDRSEGSAYWQEYDRYKNVVRNELFGASLTAGESKAFAQADINPSMRPEQIRKNLAIQKGLVQTAMKRKAEAAITSGYDPKAISQAYGVDLTGAGSTSSRPAPPKPGQLVDGYRFKGGDPADPNSWVQAK